MDEPIERLLAAAGDDVHKIVGREVGDQWQLHQSPILATAR